MHHGMQTFGTLNWAKDMLVRTYIPPNAKVVDWCTDGNHIGKLMRLKTITDLIVTGTDPVDTRKAADAARRRSGIFLCVSHFTIRNKQST